MSWFAVSVSAIEYVDGISDLNIPFWDGGFGGYFTEFFKNDWLPAEHIKYARFATPWYESSGGTDYVYQNWCNDAGKELGLTLDLALTTYHEGEKLPTASKYRSVLETFLSQCSAVRYVEPWNEPNNGITYVKATIAAEYAKEAASVCNTHNCTVIVGNLLDSSSNMVEYEKEYREALKGWTFTNWGMHPYEAVKEENEKTVSDFTHNWGDGASSLWFTEVGAYNCEHYGGSLKVPGEITQAKNAEWLVKTLLPKTKPQPEHVFYYEFLYKNNEQPQTVCENHNAKGELEKEGQPDTALYIPSSDPNAPDRPRPAAAWIFGNKGSPWGYTGGASAVYKRFVYLTGSVYPGGALPTKYYFQYGTTTGYGSNSSQGEAGSGLEYPGAMTVEGLTPATLYHYRIVAVNAEGEDAGVDRTFTTEPAPPSAITEPATEVGHTTAELKSQVYPDGLSTEYYFEYGKAGGFEHSTSPIVAGSDETWHWESAAISGLVSGTAYQFRVVAHNADGTAPGETLTFMTKYEPPALSELSSTAIEPRAATLQADINAEGASTKYHFEYWPVIGSHVSTPEQTLEPGSERVPVPVSAHVTKLQQHETYYFLLVATNAGGTTTSEEGMFTTPYAPPVVCGTPGTSEVRPASAVLNSEVNPEENETTYAFEYGTTESYGTSVPVPRGVVGSGASCVKVNDAIVGLTPDATYHFRVVAQSKGGTVYSKDQSFKAPEDWEVNRQICCGCDTGDLRRHVGVERYVVGYR